MNIPGLYQIASFLLDQDQTLSIQTYLNQLMQALGNLRSQPNQPHIQQQVVQLRDQLTAAMRQFEESLTPPQRALITELGGAGFFSLPMAESIEYEMQRNAMAPAVIANQVQDVLNKRDTFLKQLRTLKDSFDFFGIKHDDIKPGEAEIGFMVPRTLFRNRLEELTKELAEINGIVRVFSEVATGGPEPVELRQIYTSDPTFFFILNPATIAAIGATVTWLIATLKGLFELRKLRQDAEKILGNKEQLKKMFDQEIEDRVSQAVKQQADLLLTAYQGSEHRRNELAIALDLSQRNLLFRIERGMTVEIKVLMPPSDDKAKAKEHDALSNLITISQQLQFQPLEGPPILKLPCANSDTTS